MYGYLVSPLLSDMLGMSLSAGRVQSPAVRLVVDQERRIKAFKKTSYFGAVVAFDGESWQAEWNTKPFVSEDKPYVLDEALANRAAAFRQFRVTGSGQRPGEAIAAVAVLHVLAAECQSALNFDQGSAFFP